MGLMRLMGLMGHISRMSPIGLIRISQQAFICVPAPERATLGPRRNKPLALTLLT